MNKRLYVQPSIQIVLVASEKHGFMAASGKYNVDVDGQKTNQGSGALEQNPDEIDAKKHHFGWDSWDE